MILPTSLSEQYEGCRTRRAHERLQRYQQAASCKERRAKLCSETVNQFECSHVVFLYFRTFELYAASPMAASICCIFMGIACVYWRVGMAGTAISPLDLVGLSFSGVTGLPA